jgi:hypothetical protein
VTGYDGFALVRRPHITLARAGGRTTTLDSSPLVTRFRLRRERLTAVTGHAAGCARRARCPRPLVAGLVPPRRRPPASSPRPTRLRRSRPPALSPWRSPGRPPEISLVMFPSATSRFCNVSSILHSARRVVFRWVSAGLWSDIGTLPGHRKKETTHARLSLTSARRTRRR